MFSVCTVTYLSVNTHVHASNLYMLTCNLYIDHHSHRTSHCLVYLYGSPVTEVMNGNSFFQLGLNLVLYVAAPAAFLVFFGLGEDNSASSS